MRDRKVTRALIKYIPFIGMLAVYIMSLCRGMATITDGIESRIRIWTDVLTIGTIIGEIGGLLVIERFNILLTGKTPNIVDDIREESSQDVAVIYNGMIASTFIVSVIILIYICYTYTHNRLWLNISQILAYVFAIGTAIYILATYVKTKNGRHNTIISKLSNPVFLPIMICTIQLLVTRKNIVGFVYRNIYEPQSDTYLILSLIIVMCYVLAVAFCHFSNVYCLIGFAFIKRDPREIQRKIYLLQENDKKREESLRQATKYVDEKAERVGIIKKCGLTFFYYFIHIKTYILDRYYAAKYLLLFANFRITTRLGSLLDPERLRINGIRFLWSTAVLELLSLDFLLFIYLESDDPCLKFFELLSTVIIIPVLLSWISELKTKKD